MTGGFTEVAMAMFLQKRNIIYRPNIWVQTGVVYRPFEIDIMIPESNDVKYPIDIEVDDCVNPEQYVFTLPKPKPIKDVIVGDKILNHAGFPISVVSKKSFRYKGKAIKIYASRTTPFTISSNHRLFIARLKGYENGRLFGVKKYLLGGYALKKRRFEYSWIRGNQIKEGDYLVFPKIRPNSKRKTIKLIKRGFASKISNTIDIDEEISWLLGVYAAEGSYHVKGKDVQFSFNLEDEAWLANKVKRIISKRFNLTPKKYMSIEDKSLQLRIHSPLLGEFLSVCGMGAKNKSIPEYIFQGNNENKISFIKGLLIGDGWVTKNKGRPVGTAFASASRQLANEAAYLLYTLGIIVNVYERRIKSHLIKGKYCKESTLYGFQMKGKDAKIFGYKFSFGGKTQQITANGKTHVVIRKVEPLLYDGTLVDLETSDGTFLMPFISHNSHHYKKRQFNKDKYRDNCLMTSNNWLETKPHVLIPFNILRLRTNNMSTPWVVVRVPVKIISRIFRNNFTMKQKKNQKLINELDLLLFDAMNSTKPQRLFGKSWSKMYDD